MDPHGLGFWGGGGVRDRAGEGVGEERTYQILKRNSVNIKKERKKSKKERKEERKRKTQTTELNLIGYENYRLKSLLKKSKEMRKNKDKRGAEWRACVR